MTDHQEAVSTIVGINHRIGINHRDRVFSMSPLSGDLWVYTVFETLAAGGTLVMPAPDNLQNPSHWDSWMIGARVTCLTSAPQTFSTLLNFVHWHSGSRPA